MKKMEAVGRFRRWAYKETPMWKNRQDKVFDTSDYPLEVLRGGKVIMATIEGFHSSSFAERRYTPI
jgi:hypothetical protein